MVPVARGTRRSCVGSCAYIHEFMASAHLSCAGGRRRLAAMPPKVGLWPPCLGRRPPASSAGMDVRVHSVHTYEPPWLGQQPPVLRAGMAACLAYHGVCALSWRREPLQPCGHAPEDYMACCLVPGCFVHIVHKSAPLSGAGGRRRLRPCSREYSCRLRPFLAPGAAADLRPCSCTCCMSYTLVVVLGM